MPKYKIEVTAEVTSSHELLVEADNEEEAREYAYYNYSEVEGTDFSNNIEINSCEEITDG